MKRLWCLVSLVSGACSDPSTMMMMDDAGVILRPDSDNDKDYDGVKDDVDNCPQSMNGGQENEDADRFGDACDPCPHLADDNPPDADSDGVADACDPNPNFFGDSINKFEGFHAGVPQGWDQTGTWTHVSGTARAVSTTNIATLAVNTTTRTRETVLAQITIDSVTATAFAGVIDNKKPNDPSGVRCVLAIASAQEALAVTDTGDVGNASTMPYQMVAGQTYVVKLKRTNNDYACDAANGAATATVTKTVALQNTPYLTGMTVLGASVRVHWFLIIDSL